jgi:hypothetical protein
MAFVSCYFFGYHYEHDRALPWWLTGDEIK